MTSLYITGTNDQTGTLNPINLHVTGEVVSSTEYKLSVTLSIDVAISRLHFSMIIFDKEDV